MRQLSFFLSNFMVILLLSYSHYSIILKSVEIHASTPSFLKDLAMPLDRVPSASMTMTLDLSYKE
jgi:hypothetical protein